MILCNAFLIKFYIYLKYLFTNFIAYPQHIKQMSKE